MRLKPHVVFAGYPPGSVCTGTVHALGLSPRRLIAQGVIVFDEEANEYRIKKDTTK